MALQGVTTTGIYCRAECAARPKRQNVRGLRSAAEGLAAGFRPCLVCRPDRLPNLGPKAPAVEVAQALRLIAQGFLDSATTDQLAARVGYSPRQLARLFAEHVGASPDFLARAQRAHLARRLLDESDLTVTEIAFAAGFASLRTMNRVMAELFRFTPKELRAKRSRRDPLASVDGGLRLRLPFAGPLDGRRLIDYLAARAIPGVEQVDHACYRRTTSNCGAPGVVEVRDGGDGQHLELTLHLAAFGSILEQVGRVRALFALDRDSSAAEQTLRSDDVIGDLVRSAPGLRLPGAFDPFETAVRIIVGQQVSVAAASTVTGRLAERFGEAIDAPLPGGLRRLFPSPAALAEARTEELDMPRARARSLSAFARAVAEGHIDLEAMASLEQATTTLQALPGIGPWTAQLIAARVLGAPDAFPASDLGLRRTAARQLGRAADLSEGELRELADTWRPHRTTAAAYLWMAQPAPVAR
ncbi:DNA-3-methyladenine glycosylase 2 [Engelhardtia mirabilis]|uniref:DNA-3-methyladenine glycosylase II n=1 Tax=Engelhardtia mirabilis TaxID=2528011 RepID=A0A518BES1_9BACT|nr:DNA-3-methyladenine glycosylase 2 [Planctomycetes bacterium Pla133]QDU99810.1 DNA-3-methyladenine glycosylase 2 [Planctomycetes bacterium Pla86]